MMWQWSLGSSVGKPVTPPVTSTAPRGHRPDTQQHGTDATGPDAHDASHNAHARQSPDEPTRRISTHTSDEPTEQGVTRGQVYQCERQGQGAAPPSTHTSRPLNGPAPPRARRRSSRPRAPRQPRRGPERAYRDGGPVASPTAPKKSRRWRAYSRTTKHPSRRR